MKLSEAIRAARQWVPFAGRTIAWGSVSLAFGPFTKGRASLWAMQNWCRSSARGLDIAIDVSGLENVPKSGAFVYCSNHQSVLDILVLGAVLPHDYKWAAKRSLMKIPFLGWHLRLAGHVPVDRNAGSRTAAEVIKRFEEVLATGKPLLVFPEGTRSEDGIVRPFKNGGFYAAVRAGVPVIPVTLEGTHQLMKKHAFDTGDGTMRNVSVRIGAPIQPLASGREAQRVNDLRERTHAVVLDMHREMGGNVPDVIPDMPASSVVSNGRARIAGAA